MHAESDRYASRMHTRAGDESDETSGGSDSEEFDETNDGSDSDSEVDARAAQERLNFPAYCTPHIVGLRCL